MSDSLRAQYIAEFLGIGLFPFFNTGHLSTLKVAGASLGLWGIRIIWGLGISLTVYPIAGTSGTHLNPVITVVLWLFVCFPGREVLSYSVAQIAGALSGAMLAYLLCGGSFVEYESTHQMVHGSLESPQLASIFSTYPTTTLSVWQAVLAEVVIIFVLVGVIMTLADDGNGVPKGLLVPPLIGILAAVIGVSTGPLTNFATNPARDFGPKLFTWMVGWGNVATTGECDIPCFIVPIVTLIVGVRAGATICHYFIDKNLPYSLCKLEENES